MGKKDMDIEKLEEKDDSKIKEKINDVIEIISIPEHVVVHPVVLLTVVDHYNRVGKDRVCGILLGENSNGRVDVTNCYPVPFEEDSEDKSIWFFDHDYHEKMFSMFKKINAKENIVGWYSTGPTLKHNDLSINDMIRKYTKHPILTIIDVDPKDNLEHPTTAYLAVDNKPEEQNVSRKTFTHIKSEIGAYEAEEVGVEHLLRNIREAGGPTLGDKVNSKLDALKGLRKRMLKILKYLDAVGEGKMKSNPQIIYNLQNILSLTPNLAAEDISKAFAVKTNDNMLVLYLSNVIRSTLALHGLMNNRFANMKEV